MLKGKTISIVTLNPDTFSNPTLISFFKKCKESHINIIIYGPSQIFAKPEDLNNVKIQVFPINHLKFHFKGRLGWFKFAVSILRLFILNLVNRSKVIIGIDPDGIITAGQLNRILRKNLVYFSFEIFFEEENNSKSFKKFKKQERYYSNKSEIICIQDIIRKDLLQKENRIRDYMQWHLIPVSSLPPQKINLPLDLCSKFGIPGGKIIIIYSGSITEWSGLGYVISALEKGISEVYWIFIHSRYKLDFSQPLLSKLKHLELTGAPLTLHDEYFSNEVDYYNFLASFHLGLAIYIKSDKSIYVGKNIEEIGLASGKFSSYCMFGLPSIVMRSSVYEKLKTTYNFGFIVSDENEFVNLLKEKVDLPCPYEVKKLFKEKLNPDIPLTNLINDLFKIS